MLYLIYNIMYLRNWVGECRALIFANSGEGLLSAPCLHKRRRIQAGDLRSHDATEEILRTRVAKRVFWQG